MSMLWLTGPINRNMTKRNKTKAELKAQTNAHAEIIKLQKLAEEKLMPTLIKYDLTAYQSGQTLDIIKTVILSKMNDYWTNRPVIDLGLVEELTKDEKAKDRDLYKELLESLSDLTVYEANKLLESFERVLQMYAQRHVMQIKAKDLPITEIFKI